MYIRMTFRPVEVYESLEPLMKDYRKLRSRNMAGYALTFIDEFVDALLSEERVCDIILPRLVKRQILEENGELSPRKSRLLDAMEGKSDDESEGERSRSRSRSRSADRGRSRSSARSRSGSRGRSLDKGRRSASPAGSGYVSRSPSRSRSRSRSLSMASYRSRSRSISPDRMET
ncbi:hypothetical protein PQX77_000414 [Marasmius sp. AFHP31]|nr:hypothetical protein PQX77_000414 [Marasmius sp. AFHP31]